MIHDHSPQDKIVHPVIGDTQDCTGASVKYCSGQPCRAVHYNIRQQFEVFLTRNSPDINHFCSILVKLVMCVKYLCMADQ